MRVPRRHDLTNRLLAGFTSALHSPEGYWFAHQPEIEFGEWIEIGPYDPGVDQAVSPRFEQYSYDPSLVGHPPASFAILNEGILAFRGLAARDRMLTGGSMFGFGPTFTIPNTILGGDLAKFDERAGLAVVGEVLHPTGMICLCSYVRIFQTFDPWVQFQCEFSGSAADAAAYPGASWAGGDAYGQVPLNGVVTRYELYE